MAAIVNGSTDATTATANTVIFFDEARDLPEESVEEVSNIVNHPQPKREEPLPEILLEWEYLMGERGWVERDLRLRAVAALQRALPPTQPVRRVLLPTRPGRRTVRRHGLRFRRRPAGPG